VLRIYVGALLIVGGIAAQIAAHSHAPVLGGIQVIEGAVGSGAVSGERLGPSGLSQTAYDLLRIGGWALIVFGAVTVAVGLIQYRARHV
jgi:hypothetical protein